MSRDMSRAALAGLAASLVLGLVPIGPTTSTVEASADPLAYEHYIGALHEHSGYSDGWPGSRPADYFAMARDEFGLDFLGSGEHSDSADVPVVVSEQCLSDQIARCAIADEQNPADSFRKWEATLEQARAATTEDFTAFRGFEWTSDRFGHINVYFSQHDANAKADGGYAVMDAFWDWFTRPPLLGGGADGLATFNHPDAKKLADQDPTVNWNDFAYVPAADARMVGLEVFNGNKDYDEWYSHALDRGWHVGAIGAEDKGHEPDDRWGAPEWAKTVMIARDRSEPALREAMLARRFYAVLDNDIRIAFSAGGRPMGSRIGAAPGSTVPITATVTGGAATLELVTNEGRIAASSNAQTLSFDAPVEGGERYFFLRVRNAAGDPVAYSSPVWISPGGDATRSGEWIAGDFHVHTCYSHDVYCPHAKDDNTGPDEFYTLGSTVEMQFCAAAARGLDFLTITDHNDVRSQSDPGFGACGVMPVDGYENSLRGHAQMIGATKLYPDANDAQQVNELVEHLHRDGGAFQVNHPAGDSVDYPHDADWGYGYEVVPDTVEVWNISRLWQPPFPSGSSNDDAIRYWEGWLDRGYRVAATGGSDNHWISTQAAQGVGQPTTWVFVEERSRRGVVEAIREGRTFISHQPPSVGGPKLYLEGDGDGDGRFEAMVGDSVPPGNALRVRVDNAPGSFLRIVTDGGEVPFDPVAVTGTSFVHGFTVPPGASWVRAEIFDPDALQERKDSCDGTVGDQTTYCRNQLLVLAMTSAIYFEEDLAPTELAISAPASGRTTDPVDVTATLTSAGDPLADRAVVLTLGSQSQTVATDANGIAAARFDLADPPGDYEVTAAFAGDERHRASDAAVPFTIDPEVTTLVYDGDTSATGETVVLSAVLTEDDGLAVGGRAITFRVGGQTLSAATDEEGRAETTAIVPDHGQRQGVSVDFAGDDVYLPSATTATIKWGKGRGLMAAPTSPVPASAPVADRDGLTGLSGALGALAAFVVALGALRRAARARRL